MHCLEVDLSGVPDDFFSSCVDIVYVGNLHLGMTEDELYYGMCAFGDCQWLYFVRGEAGDGDYNGCFLGHAYVKFKREESVQEYMEHYEELNTLNLGVPVHPMISEMNVNTRFYNAGKISVSGYGVNVQPHDLCEAFAPFGKIRRITMTLAGIAIVEFVTEWDARACMEALDNTEIGGKPIYMRWFDRSSTDGLQPITILPFNLAPNITDNDLYNIFRHLGCPLARVERNSDGSSRGTGIVRTEIPSIDTPLLYNYVVWEPKPGNMTLLRATNQLTTACTGWTLNYAYQTPRIPKQNWNIKLPLTEQRILCNPARLYVVPEKFRKSLPGLNRCDMSADAEPSDSFLGDFSIHVSLLAAHMSRKQFKKACSQFGDVVFCHLGVEKNFERYGIVSFKRLKEARVAVNGLNNMMMGPRDKPTRVFRAALIDTYQLYHYRHLQTLGYHYMYVPQVSSVPMLTPAAMVSSMQQHQQQQQQAALNTHTPPSTPPLVRNLNSNSNTNTTPRPRPMIPAPKAPPQQLLSTLRPAPIYPPKEMHYYATPGLYTPYFESQFSQETRRKLHDFKHSMGQTLFELFEEQKGYEQKLLTAQEKHRPDAVKAIDRLYQKLPADQRAEMVDVMLQVPMLDLNDMLSNDNTLRGYFIRRSLAKAMAGR